MAVGMATSIVHVFVMSKKNHDIILVDDMIKMQIDQNKVPEKLIQCLFK